jgi:hypothetical protein
MEKVFSGEKTKNKKQTNKQTKQTLNMIGL